MENCERKNGSGMHQYKTMCKAETESAQPALLHFIENVTKGTGLSVLIMRNNTIHMEQASPVDDMRNAFLGVKVY